MMQRNLSRREQNIFLLTLAAVFSAAFYHFIFVPLQEKKHSLNGRITIEKQKMNKDRGIIQQAKGIDGKYHRYAKQFYRTGTEEEIIASTLKDLEGIARKLNLDVSDLKPKSVEALGPYSQFSVSLVINNDLRDVVRFLYALQQGPYFFDVKELRLEQITQRRQSTLKTRLVLSRAFMTEYFSAGAGAESFVKNNEEERARMTAAPFKPLSVYVNGIGKRDLFASMTNRIVFGNKALLTGHPALDKQIRLIGVLVDKDPKAIIEDLKNKETHFLSKGESIGAALLEEISEDRVTFIYNNERVDMML